MTGGNRLMPRRDGQNGRTTAGIGETIHRMSLSSRVMQQSPWVVFIFYLITTAAVAQSLQVIDLKHRTAAEVIPVLQPLLEQGGALSGQDYKLFVRTSPANLSQLRAALAQIDRAPKQLFVSVRKSTREQVERERVQASGTVRSGNAAVAVNERARASSGVTVHATDASARNQSDGVASVQVIEGGSAFISRGSDVPIVTSVAAGGGRRPFAAATTTY